MSAIFCTFGALLGLFGQASRIIPALIEEFRREYQEGKITKEAFERSVNELTVETTIPRTKKVSIAHVPDFIRSVMIYPLAPAELDKETAYFCSEHSLNYLGKSEMYQFKM